MSDWIKFHRELTRGKKKWLPRATRFIYLELSLEARRGRGDIDLDPELDVVEAVEDLIGGSRAEIKTALDKLLKPPSPTEDAMLAVVDAPEGRVLRVTAWRKWNSVDSTAAVRAENYRARQREAKRDTNGVVTRDATDGDAVTSRVPDRDSSRDVTPVITPPSRPSKRDTNGVVTRPDQKREDQKSPGVIEGSADVRAPARASATPAGVEFTSAFLLRCAEVFGEAVRKATGNPFGLDGLGRRDLADVCRAHMPKSSVDEALAWLDKHVQKFIAATEDDHVAHGGFKPRKMLDWLNGGAPSKWGVKSKERERDRASQADREQEERAEQARRRREETERRQREEWSGPVAPPAVALSALNGLLEQWEKPGASKPLSSPPAALPAPPDDFVPTTDAEQAERERRYVESCQRDAEAAQFEPPPGPPEDEIPF